MRAGRRDPSWHPSYPRPDDVDAASMARAGDPWGPRHILCGDQAVGTIGLMGQPVGGEVEVGFGLVEEARGRGLATEALRALLGETDRAGVRVWATVHPENAASLRVLAGCGFTEVRGTNDEGLLVLVRPLPGGGGRV
jgi:RimJ/RimL family protein N-acetyltransferase